MKNITIISRMVLKGQRGGYKHFDEVLEVEDIFINSTPKKLEKRLNELNKRKQSRLYEAIVFIPNIKNIKKLVIKKLNGTASEAELRLLQFTKHQEELKNIFDTLI